MGKALRLGSRGEAVACLQERLRELGYDPGPVDGIYGYQTFEAVQELQRDCRLRMDGVAGKQVMAVLQDPRLPLVRRAYTLAPGESLSDAARALGVPVHRLRRALSLPRRAAVRGGQRVVVWERLVVAEIKPGQARDPGLRAAARRLPLLSALAELASAEARVGETPGGPDFPEPPAERSGSLEGLPVWTTLHTRDGSLVPGLYAPGAVQRLLHVRSARRAFLGSIRKWAAQPGPGPLHLDLGGLRWGDGARWLALVREAAAVVRRAGGDLAVSVPLGAAAGPLQRLANDIDIRAAAAAAAWLILVPPAIVPGPESPRPLSYEELASRIRAVVRQVPPWKCLLAVPVCALVVPVGGREQPTALSYQRAVGLACAGRIRPAWNEQVGRPSFRYVKDDREWAVWLENRASLGRKLDLVDAMHLGGVVVSALGEEDGRVWTAVAERWKVHKPGAE